MSFNIKWLYIVLFMGFSRYAARFSCFAVGKRHLFKVFDSKIYPFYPK